MEENNIDRFYKDFHEYYLEVLKPTYIELKSFLKNLWSPEYWTAKYSEIYKPTPAPINRVYYRIKRPESIKDKILRKPETYSDGLSINSIKKMTDVIGGRIIVYFLSDLTLIDKELREINKIEISESRLPVAYLSEDLLSVLALSHLASLEKESGYASIHYIIRFTESSVPKESRPWIEIQVRTITEHAWCEIEHYLGYKPGKSTAFDVKTQFRMISDLLKVIDNQFNYMKTNLSHYREEGRYKDSDPLNPENFPIILNRINLSCSQREINALIKILVSNKIFTVGDFFNCALPKNLEIIKNVYNSKIGKFPTTFEIIAAIAEIKDISSEKIPEKVNSLIVLLTNWEQLKKSTEM